MAAGGGETYSIVRSGTHVPLRRVQWGSQVHLRRKKDVGT